MDLILRANDWMERNRQVVIFIQGIASGYIIFFFLNLIAKKEQRPASRMDSPTKKTNIDEDCKMVLVVRSDLQMGKGKVAAQCAHATLDAYKAALKQSQQTKDWLSHWESEGMAKVTLKCQDEEEMLHLQLEARKLSLVAKSIIDAGRTQIAAGSRTVLAIGPGMNDLYRPYFCD
jgi:peptidyl-tRNA hydrolase, PTH2 family